MKDKRDFKNMTRYDNNIFELKKILKIMNTKKSTRLLHERLIERYMVSNNNE